MSKLLDLIGEQNSGSTHEFLKLSNLYLGEMQEMRKRKFRKILEQEFELETLGKFNSGLKKIITSNKMKLKEKLAKENNNGYFWITINPKPAVTLETFRKKIVKLINRKLFDNVTYVYEQRGKTISAAGTGFHCHILAKRNLNYKPYKCKECVQNTMKNIVGNAKNPQQLNIQVIGPDFRKDKMEYILGQNKTGLGKDLKQNIDIIWRKKYNIKEYYNGQIQENETI